MKQFRIQVVAAAIGLAFSVCASAQTMSKDAYNAGKDDISAAYKSAKSACATYSGNANDICEANAKGRSNVAMAQLEATYSPSLENSYKVRVARAEADLAVAKERCDDSAGNVKDVCIKQAKAVAIAAEADAKSDLKSANANDKAAATGEEARKDAASDKASADYAVAREKCDAYAGSAKDNCMVDAKVRFGRP